MKYHPHTNNLLCCLYYFDEEQLYFSNKLLNKYLMNVTYIYLINLLQCFFGIECHVSLDKNPKPGFNTLLLRLIPVGISSACPH